MGRTLRLTNGADRFTQGLATQNIEINLLTLGGNDVVILNRVDGLGGGNRVNTGGGRDSVVNLLESGNVIFLGAGNDTYVGRGFGSFGSDLIDQVFAGTGNDRIAVETFQSRYFGQAGNDTFFSVGWQNTFNGGLGIDTISYLPRDDDAVQSRSGVTVDLQAGFAFTGANRRETLVSIENVTGSGQDDTLIGSAGVNRLQGGGGFDELSGGGGADRFVFSSASDSPVSSTDVDLILDFRSAQRDKIVLTPMDANSRAAGNQNFTYIEDDAFGGRAGELRFESLAGGILVMGDTNGDRVADFQIGFQGVFSIAASDFLF